MSKYNRKLVCEQCHGEGYREVPTRNGDVKWEPCAWCNGKGVKPS